MALRFHGGEGGASVRLPGTAGGVPGSGGTECNQCEGRTASTRSILRASELKRTHSTINRQRRSGTGFRHAFDSEGPVPV